MTVITISFPNPYDREAVRQAIADARTRCAFDHGAQAALMIIETAMVQAAMGGGYRSTGELVYG